MMTLGEEWSLDMLAKFDVFIVVKIRDLAAGRSYLTLSSYHITA
jgi:hypothetical protein